MRSFEELLQESSSIHGHHCAGQVLGCPHGHGGLSRSRHRRAQRMQEASSLRGDGSLRDRCGSSGNRLFVGQANSEISRLRQDGGDFCQHGNPASGPSFGERRRASSRNAICPRWRQSTGCPEASLPPHARRSAFLRQARGAPSSCARDAGLPWRLGSNVPSAARESIFTARSISRPHALYSLRSGRMLPIGNGTSKTATFPKSC